jgi:hypothetical protein
MHASNSKQMRVLMVTRLRSFQQPSAQATQQQTIQVVLQSLLAPAQQLASIKRRMLSRKVLLQHPTPRRALMLLQLQQASTSSPQRQEQSLRALWQPSVQQ